MLSGEQSTPAVITGNVLFNFFKNIFSGVLFLTGRATDSSEGQNVSVEVPVSNNVSSEQVVVEYYTDAPYSVENTISESKKEVSIVGPDEVHYQDVLAFAELPKEVGSTSEINLLWNVNGSSEKVSFDSSDEDGNGLIDTISWVVPHLSEQNYTIILITKASHLDSNRTVIEDVYDLVSAQDSNYSEIQVGDYVRVSFEQNLTNKNDITFYGKSIEGASVEVYEVNSDNKIATFENVQDDKKYQIFLDNLTSESQDTFDLKVLGSAVQFDYIVDPAPSQAAYNGSNVIYRCGWVDAAGSYKINQTISNTDICLNVSASNVIVNGMGNTIQSSSSSGVYSFNTLNVTIQNVSIDATCSSLGMASVVFDSVNNSLITNISIPASGCTTLARLYNTESDTIENSSGVGSYIGQAVILNRSISTIIRNLNISKMGGASCDSNMIAGTACAGGIALYSSNYSEIYNNNISNIQSVSHNGTYLLLESSKNNQIYNNRFFTDDGYPTYGIYLNSSSGQTKSNTIYNNIFNSSSSAVVFNGGSYSNYWFFLDYSNSATNIFGIPYDFYHAGNYY